jgi:hypothetical protein
MKKEKMRMINKMTSLDHKIWKILKHSRMNPLEEMAAIDKILSQLNFLILEELHRKISEFEK